MKKILWAVVKVLVLAYLVAQAVPDNIELFSQPACVDRGDYWFCEADDDGYGYYLKGGL